MCFDQRIKHLVPGLCPSIQQPLIWSNNPTIFHQDAWWNARSMNYGMARLRRRWAEMRDLEVKIASKLFLMGKLSIYQSIHLSAYPTYLSAIICKFVNLSIHASTHLLSTYLSKIYVPNYTQYQEKNKLCQMMLKHRQIQFGPGGPPSRQATDMVPIPGQAGGALMWALERACPMGCVMDIL